MSNFGQLKAMWENRGTQQIGSSPPPPPKVAPGKLQIPNISPPMVYPKSPQNTANKVEFPNRETLQPNNPPPQKLSPRPNPTPTQMPKSPKNMMGQLEDNKIEKEIPRQSVAELRNQMQGKFKFGGPMMGAPIMGAPMPIRNTNIQSIAQTPKQEHPIILQDEKEQQEARFSYRQSKQNVEAMLQKNKQGQNSNPFSKQKRKASEQVYINLKNDQEKGNSLTPEQRAEQIMSRLFSQHEEAINRITREEKQKEESKQQVKSLKVRQKKEAKNLGNFDDA